MVTATLSRQTVVSLQGGGSLIFHPKARTVFRLTLAPVIEPRRRYVSMPKPLLNLGDIGIVGESVRCRCGPQRMHTEAVDLGADARFQAVFPNDIAVDRCRIQVPVKATGPVVLHRPGTEHLAYRSDVP